MLLLHLSVAGMLCWALPGGSLCSPMQGPFKSLGWGRKDPPNPLPQVPPVLWQMFQKRRNSIPGVAQTAGPCWVEEFSVPGNIIRILPDQGQFIRRADPPRWLCLEKRLYFNFSAVDRGEEVTLLQLEIKLKPSRFRSWIPDPPFELSLYKATQMALHRMSTHAYSRALLSEQSFLHGHQSFTFNITGVAKEWQTPGRNLGLLLEIGAPAVVAPETCSDLDPLLLDASLLVVSLAPWECRSARRRRSPYHVPAAAGGNVCKPRRLYISFSEVGWENWVIAPQGYLANYCSGECPFPLTEELNSTNHAILQTMAHSLDPEGTPQPCCVPVRLSPISILYYDNNDNVVLRHYEDMVVDECGCR